jgi:hypothetical protein
MAATMRNGLGFDLSPQFIITVENGALNGPQRLTRKLGINFQSIKT